MANVILLWSNILELGIVKVIKLSKKIASKDSGIIFMIIVIYFYNHDDDDDDDDDGDDHDDVTD